MADAASRSLKHHAGTTRGTTATVPPWLRRSHTQVHRRQCPASVDSATASSLPARHRGRGARVLQPARHTSLFSLSLTVSDLLSQDSRVRSRQLRAVPPPPSCRVPFERWCLLVSVHQLVIVASCSLVSLWLPACLSSAPWAQRDQHTLGVFGEGTACWEKELWSGE